MKNPTGIANDYLKSSIPGLIGWKLIGKVLGKAAGVVGWGVSAYSSYKTYKSFTKKDKFYQQASPLEAELEKWQDAIMFIGNKHYSVGQRCEIDDRGAINLLGYKELYFDSNTRYEMMGTPNREYHAKPSEVDASTANKSPSLLLPDVKQAKQMIKLAIEAIGVAKNELSQPNFEEKRSQLIASLQTIDEKIAEEYTPNKDYTAIQEELEGTVVWMRDFEATYNAKMGELKKERNKRRVRYAAAAVATGLIGQIKLPGKKKPVA